jgi:hypothetical protein
MLAELAAKGVNKVYIAYDNDGAGSRGAAKLAEKLSILGINCYRLSFPEGMDANDFIRKTEKTTDAFKDILDKAELIKEAQKKDSFLLAGDDTTKADKQKINWEEKKGEYLFSEGPRKYLVRGLEDNKSNTTLKVFLRIVCEGKFHNDNSLDLFNAKAVSSFVKTSAEILDIEKKTIKKDLNNITLELDKILAEILARKEKPQLQEYKVNLRYQHQAMELLSEPLLIKHIIDYIKKCGIVGESLNSIICFLSTISRKLKDPLHVVIQSESSAGKSTLLSRIVELVPPEDLLYFTQLTAQSLYYMEPGALKNKVLAIAELDGAEKTLYPLKQLMSENKISISSTGSDPETGKYKTGCYANEGPTAVMITVPREGLDEEIENRTVMLAMNEGVEQTKLIQANQRLRRSIEGIKLAQEKEVIVELFHNLQRLVKQVPVYNPYANDLNFSFQTHHTRRHNDKYLIMIETLTLLNQYQREKINIKTSGGYTNYVKTHLIDIAIGNFIARRIFGHSLDELPIQSRNFLNKLEEMVLATCAKKHIDVEDCWIYRKQMREFTKLSNTRVHEHVGRLVQFEYLTYKRDTGGYSYSLLYNPQEEKKEKYRLNLKKVSALKKKASKNEWEEYISFLPSLAEIFKALDPTWQGELES